MAEYREKLGIEIDIATKVFKILIPTIIVIMICTSLITGLASSQQLRTVPQIITIVFLLVMWRTTNKKRIALTLNLSIVLMWTIAIVGMSLNGATSSTTYMSLVIGIAVTSWLYGYRAAIVFYVFFVALGGIFVCLDTFGVLPSAIPPPPLWLYWVAGCATGIVVLGVTAIPNYALRSALSEGEKKHIAAEKAYQREVKALRQINAQGKLLRQKEQNFREIFNSTSEAIFILDAATEAVLDVNESMLRMYGFKCKRDALAAKFGDLSASDSCYINEMDKGIIRKVVEENIPTLEWQAKRCDGTTFWVEVSLRKARIGGADRLLIVVRDISKRKQREEERQKIESALIHVRKMDVVSQMAEGIAHDFNNLLLAMMGNIDFVLEKLERDSENREILQDAYKASEQAVERVKRLMAFSRHQVTNPVNLDINVVVNDTLDIISQNIGKEVKVNFTPGNALENVSHGQKPCGAYFGKLVRQCHGCHAEGRASDN